jgi:hypothetical protein
VLEVNCSAAFFFDTAGRASVAHLSAGVEPAQAREAASQARQAGTFDSVVVYSPDSLKTRDIKSAIRAVLGDSVDVSENVYRLSDLRRGERYLQTGPYQRAHTLCDKQRLLDDKQADRPPRTAVVLLIRESVA